MRFVAAAQLPEDALPAMVNESVSPHDTNYLI